MRGTPPRKRPEYSDVEMAKAASRVLVKKIKKSDKPNNERAAKFTQEEIARVEVAKSIERQAKMTPEERKKAKRRDAAAKARYDAIAKGRLISRQEFVQSQADIICERLTEGHDLRTILSEIDVKFVDMCHWLKINKDFRDAFSIARENVAHLHISQIIHIADSAKDKADVEMLRLQIQTRQWVASKILSKLYGDKIVHAGDETSPVVTKLVSDSNELLAKIRGTK